MATTVSAAPKARNPIVAWMAAQLEENRPKGAISTLDGVRGIACLLVMAYHINLLTQLMGIWTPAGQPLLGAIILSGFSGVTLFFVLSGFLLFQPYVKALISGKAWPDTKIFYMRRALRIIPAYYVSLFFLVIFTHPEYIEPAHFKTLPLFFLFLMDSTKVVYRHINGPYWTLAIEWQFYMLLPLIALGMRFVTWRVKPTMRRWTVVGCLVAMIVWGLVTRAIGSFLIANPTMKFPFSHKFVTLFLYVAYGYNGKFLEDFAIGMLVALCFVAANDAANREKLAQLLRWLSPLFFLSGLLILLFQAMRFYSQSTNYAWPVANGIFQTANWADELVFSIGYGCCILAILFGASWFQGVFSSAPIRWVGMISFSLYIWHLPLLFIFRDHDGPYLLQHNLILAYSLFWVWAIVIIIPFNYMMYLAIERPGMRFSDRLRKRIQARKAVQTKPSPLPEFDEDGLAPTLVSPRVRYTPPVAH